MAAATVPTTTAAPRPRSVIDQVNNLETGVLVGPFKGIDVLASLLDMAPVREGYVAVAVSAADTIGVYDLEKLLERAANVIFVMEDKLNAD